tara:strand:+ start:392 stop:799 length:408 start_codon:yes stop_codon:yes gene_type:complete
MALAIGRNNLFFGWLWIFIGVIIGAVMGLWSFNGPFSSPFGDYSSLARRFARLSHISFIGLAILNILYGYEIDKVKLTRKTKLIGSKCFVYGSIFLSLFLLVSAFFEIAKYFLVFPVTLILISIGIILIGLFKNF